MPSFKIIGLPVLEKKILKVFTIYGRGGHLGYGHMTIFTNLCSLFLWRLHVNFVFDWQSGIREKRCLKIMVKYMYISPVLGQTNPGDQFFFQKCNFLLIWTFAASFSEGNGFDWPSGFRG